MNIEIRQDSRTEQFGSSGANIIEGLYELAKNNSNLLILVGNIRSSYAYGNQVDFLNTHYNPDFVVDADNRYIPFTDNAVLNVLKNTVGDGTGVTETLFSNLTNLTTLGFTNNTSITDFREGVLLDNRDIRIDMGFINGCTNLNVMGIPPYLTYYGTGTTANCSPSKIIISNWANWVASTFGNTNALCDRDNHDLCTLNEDGSLTVVKNVTLPQGCDFADLRAMCGKFYKSSVEEVTLPTSVTRIADFLYSKIRTVNFPLDSELTKIFVCCFYECLNLVLDVATLPLSITDIGQWAFYGCTGVTGDLNLPNLETIDYGAFLGTKISKVSNLGRVTKIDESAFQNCSDLIEIHLPTTVTYLRLNWFTGTPSNATPIIVTGVDNAVNHDLYKWQLWSKNIQNPVCFNSTTESIISAGDQSGDWSYTNAYFLPKMKKSMSGGGTFYEWVQLTAFTYRNMGNSSKTCRFGLLYFKDIEHFGIFTFFGTVITNLVINNVTPPDLIIEDNSGGVNMSQLWQTLLFPTAVDGAPSITTLWVPDSAVSTYQSNPLYSGLTIKGINTKTNGTDYDLPRYATYADWEAAAAVCRLNNTDVPVALIEEYM